jgi:tRNA(His) 5'-end guanylyltransferase
MRAREQFRALRLLPGTWAIVRVDGRAFTPFTARRFEKPFDARFRDLMIVTARALLAELQGVYAWTGSDEVSVALPPAWNLFGRRHEKLVSVSAGIASAAFTLACGEAVHFDSRVWLGAAEAEVVEYFRWRQLDAARCALHAWCHWTLRRKGMGAEQAARHLLGRGTAYMNELLFREGINFSDLPAWQRRGIGLYWETRPKEGYDPVRHQTVTTMRRRINVDLELPLRAAYDDFIRGLLQKASCATGSGGP